MTYIPHPDEREMTYEAFKRKYDILFELVKYESDVIEKFLETTQALRGWHVFFNPSITISEVNNKNMGHVYLGKFRIPIAFSKKKGPNNQPIPHVITFIVCKYDEMPGEKFQERRKEEAYSVAFEKLRIHYPERFIDSPDYADNHLISRILEVRAFQSKWGLID
jgi:hypothetical protein